MAAEFDPHEAGIYVSPLRTTALQLNELYKELLSVGFKTQEALFLIGQVLVSGVMIPYNEDDDYQDESDEQDFNDDEDGDFI